MSEEKEFSVAIFLEDDTHFYEARWIGPKEAVELAWAITKRPAAKVGIIRSVIITDGGDFTNWQWKFGEGITYPTPDMLRADGTN